MSSKNHKKINNRLIQTDKKYSQLKLKQKGKIADWIYQETKKYCDQFDQIPEPFYPEEVLERVYERIEEADIWIPYYEVAKHYKKKQTQILRRIRRESKEELDSRIQQVCFMNMCMITDGKGNVVALDKVGDGYSGTTFPGGHVEIGETFADAMVREVREETGLIITNPKLKGIYHWYKGNIHNIGYLYRVDSYEGELTSSEEGRVYWVSEEEYANMELAHGMDKVLQIMNSDEFSECYLSDGVEILK